MGAVLSIPTRLTHVVGERDERLVGRGWVSGRTPGPFHLRI
jgi:hypothetical protein